MNEHLPFVTTTSARQKFQRAVSMAGLWILVITPWIGTVYLLCFAFVGYKAFGHFPRCMLDDTTSLDSERFSVKALHRMDSMTDAVFAITILLAIAGITARKWFPSEGARISFGMKWAVFAGWLVYIGFVVLDPFQILTWWLD